MYQNNAEREEDLKENRGRVKYRLMVLYSKKKKNNGILPKKSRNN